MITCAEHASIPSLQLQLLNMETNYFPDFSCEESTYLSTVAYANCYSYSGEELQCPGYDFVLDQLTPESEDISTDDSIDSDDTEYTERSPNDGNARESIERERKNGQERVRVGEKKIALSKLKEKIMMSGSIEDAEKKKRFTEEHTLRQSIALLRKYKAKLLDMKENPSPPFAQKAQLSKKSTKHLVCFSRAFRRSFKQILTHYRNREHTTDEIEVSNDEVTKFLNGVWDHLTIEEKQKDWCSLAQEDLEEIVSRASKIMTEMVL